jgi:hypothetical protein
LDKAESSSEEEGEKTKEDIKPAEVEETKVSTYLLYINLARLRISNQ